METKTCCRCGAEKPVTDFRTYYNGRRGHYRYCLKCEKLEFRRKYLVDLKESKGLSEAQQRELDAINELYDLRAEHDLEDPRIHAGKRTYGTMGIIAEEMKQYK